MNEINLPLFEKAELILAQIDKIAPDTQNSLVKQLRSFQNQLSDNTFQSGDTSLFNNCLTATQQLVTNLLLAQDAALFAMKRMKATNSPYSAMDNFQLEITRKKINETDVLKTFSFFKDRREKIGVNDPRILGFEQTAYSKGTGINMAMWYRYSSRLLPEKKLGNCSEQSNLAFVYLYTIVREAISSSLPSPINSLNRVDVENSMGGHSYIIINGLDIPKFQFNEQYSSNEFRNLIPAFDSTGVVVDPWNTKSPFYPASDIPSLMPECGLKGTVNIEFRLSFASQKEEPVMSSSHRISASSP